jgi:hypothetical protein
VESAAHLATLPILVSLVSISTPSFHHQEFVNVPLGITKTQQVQQLSLAFLATVTAKHASTL